MIQVRKFQEWSIFIIAGKEYYPEKVKVRCEFWFSHVMGVKLKNCFVVFFFFQKSWLNVRCVFLVSETINFPKAIVSLIT